jgi:hypothetical protein
MTLKGIRLFVLVLVALPMLAVSARADTVGIGAAAVYAVLGEAGVTNTGPSLIYGDVGGSAGTPSVGGVPPGIVVLPAVILTGSTTAFSNATTAYTTAQGLGGAINESGNTLGSLGTLPSLGPGVYQFTSSAYLNGLLILNAGDSNTASWTFQIGSTLTTASGSSIEVINAGGNGQFNGSITWATLSGATLGTTTNFLGTIISEAGDVIETGATIGCGRVISLDASVTLDTNTIVTPATCTVTGATGGTGGTIGPLPSAVIATPEPGTLLLLGMGIAGLLGLTQIRRFSRT